MFHKFLLVPAIMSIAGLFMATDSAFAQHGGHSGGHGGGHGGGHVGGGHVGGGHVGAGHYGGHVAAGHYGGHVGAGHYGGHVGAGYNHGAYGRGYYGGGYGRGYYGGYGHGYYGGYSGFLDSYYYPWYDTNSWDYPYADYSDDYVAPALPYYGTSAQSYASPSPIVADSAYIRVIVPDPQASVWFDGKLTAQSGADRLFTTPSLTMGSTYNYQIRAAWMQGRREVTKERTVSVTPGQTTFVDFTR
jgi:uncharacterized protein (TIGR03000 family)